MTTFRLHDVIAPAFRTVHQQVKQGDCGELMLAGGRGSGKSSYVSVELLLQLLQNPQCHAVVLRKRENRLRTSVFTQMQWAIRQLGLCSCFKQTVSPMEMQYLPTGQKIYFFGMDDPDKIKSIKAPFGYFSLLWFEEYDQFTGPEEVRSVEQSILRGGERFLVFKSFNPPQAVSHWANQDFLQQREGRLCCRSSYLDMPPSWLGQRFLQDAKRLQEQDPHAYENEYLGLANGSGGQVFRNLTVREILQEERDALSDRLRHGIDWGWYPDPFVYVQAAYLPSEQRVFLLDEFSGNFLSNESIVQELKSRSLQGQRILCDSGGEGQKSASELRRSGLNVHCAKKGPGSVDYSMKWLCSRREIVVDPHTCPFAAREFGNYSYQAEGGFPDRDNHSIDALRYALENEIRNEKKIQR